MTGEQIAAQADQLGVRHAAGVVVLAGRRYVTATRLAWPHALDPLAGSRSMGEQLSRLAAITRLGPAALSLPGLSGLDARPVAR